MKEEKVRRGRAVRSLAMLAAPVPAPAPDIATEWARLMGCTEALSAAIKRLGPSLVRNNPEAAVRGYIEAGLEHATQMGVLGVALLDAELLDDGDHKLPCPHVRMESGK